MKERCLNPTCERKPESRGLCSTCYGVAREAVRSGDKTWEGLEAEGTVLPKKKRSSSAREWIYGPKKKKGTAK